jgi:hypothetical protein
MMLLPASEAVLIQVDDEDCVRLKREERPKMAAVPGVKNICTFCKPCV